MPGALKPFAPGARVRDAFKVPKPGDECCVGKVVRQDGQWVQVKWDDGKTTNIDRMLLDPHRDD